MSSTQTKWAGAIFAVLFIIAMLMLNSKVKQDHHHFFEQKLSLLGSLRKSALESYIETVTGELSFWVESDLLETASRELDDGWYALPGDHKQYLRTQYVTNNPHPEGKRSMLADANDGSQYSIAHQKIHNLAHNFVEERHYHDFLLIDLKGNIIYTVEKNDDFGENLLSGDLQGTALARAFERALADDSDAVHFTDFAPYAPNDNKPTVFITKRMHDDLGRVDGVVAVELDTESIMDIMRHSEGMGESGQTYLVGTDLMMRSDSRFSKDSTVLNTKADTATVNKALAGETGVEITPDYRGIDVLSAYDHIDIGETRWAILAEIDEAEISKTNPVSTMSIAITAFFAYLLGLLVSFFVSRFEAPEEGMGLEALEDLQTD